MPADLPPVTNLFEMARYRGLHDADRIAFTYLVDGETDERHLTFGELDREARRLAARLQSLGKAGDRVLLLFDPGLDYIWGFFGVVYAGMIPVPAYPPDLMRAERLLGRLQALAEDCNPAIVLGTRHSLGLIGGLLNRPGSEGESRRTVVTVDDRADWEPLPWTPPTIAPDDLAFLQYTSGSTSTPRGVMVTHANLMSHLRLLQDGWESVYPSTGERGVVGVSWLPFYHDMGLIAGVFGPFYGGKRMVMMSPLSFIQRPIRWLWAISRYRPLVTGGPNFAYDLCVSKFRKEEAEGLDLSCCLVAANGAEPVRPETLERFDATFAPYGWDRRAWMPSYGMAETTLGVTMHQEGPKCPIVEVSLADLQQNRVRFATPEDGKTRRVVGCGTAIQESEVRLVDPVTFLPVPPDGVGEVWVRGTNVTSGYWNRAADTEATFGARLADTGEGPYLRTGDYGFFHEGNLYLTGRLKETMIFWGRNVYPQDIEQTVASCHEALRVNGGAAFAIEEAGQEQLVVVQEVQRPGKLDLPGLAATIRQAVMSEHRVPLYALVLIRPGALSKTSSGKIQRGETRKKFLANELDVVAQWTFDTLSAVMEPVTSLSRSDQQLRDEASIRGWLRQRIAQTLGVPAEQIAEDEPLSHYVMDSISLVAIARDLEVWLDRSIAPTILMDSPSLETLARRLTDPAYYVTTAPPGQLAIETLSEGELDLALAQLLEEGPAPTSAATETVDSSREGEKP